MIARIGCGSRQLCLWLTNHWYTSEYALSKKNILTWKINSLFNHRKYSTRFENALTSLFDMRRRTVLTTRAKMVIRSGFRYCIERSPQISCNQGRLLAVVNIKVDVGEANARDETDSIVAAKHFKQKLNHVNRRSDTIPVCLSWCVERKAISPSLDAKLISCACNVTSYRRHSRDLMQLGMFTLLKRKGLRLTAICT